MYSSWVVSCSWPPYGNLWRHFWSLQLEECPWHPTDAVEHPVAHGTAPYCKVLCSLKCQETPDSNLIFSLFIHTVGILTVPSWVVTKSRWNSWCRIVCSFILPAILRAALFGIDISSELDFHGLSCRLSIVPIWFHDVCPWQALCMVCLCPMPQLIGSGLRPDPN